MARKDGKDRGVYEKTQACPECRAERCTACQGRRTPHCPACPCKSCKSCKGTGKRGTGIWWVRYQDAAGEEHREKVGPKSTAIQVYHQRKTEIRLGKFDPEAVARRRRPRLREVIADYLEESKANKRSWKDDVRYARVWSEALGDRLLEEVRPADVESWRRKKQREASPATVNRHVAFLKHLFNVAIRDEKTDRNPVERIKMLEENNKRERYLTDEEELLLRAACNPEAWRCIELALVSGMRISEQVNLRWENVDFTAGIITVPRSKHGEKRHVWLNRDLRAVLEELPSRGTSPFLFPSRKDGMPMHPNTPYKSYLLPALKKAGIQGFRWHDLRHTYGTRLREAGVPIEDIQVLMGHKNYVTTQRYAHHSHEKLSSAAERVCRRLQTPL